MKRKVLIIIDPQNDFISGSLGSEIAKNTVPNIVKYIKENNWDEIAVTMDSHTESGYAKSLEGKKLPIKHCQIGTEGFDINSDISSAITDVTNDNKKYIPLNFYFKHSFGSISFAEKFIEKISTTGIGFEDIELYICGFCTDICVIVNALILRTYLKNTEIYIKSDCCAGSSEENHKSALNVMKSCQINII